MTAVVLRVELTEQPVELSDYEALVAHESAGAVVGFAGVVRDHDDGRTVIRLEYSAHPSAHQTSRRRRRRDRGGLSRRAGHCGQPPHRHAADR